jgi:hypothetical protein
VSGSDATADARRRVLAGIALIVATGVAMAMVMALSRRA